MIKFPKMNIATSVVNRILNANDAIASRAEAGSGERRGAPNVPDSGPLGAGLDAAIAAPTGPLAPTDPAMVSDLTTGPLFP